MAAAAVLRLPEQVTFDTVPGLLDQAVAAVAAGAREVDLSDCTYFDSALVALLLELSRRALAAGAQGAPVLRLRSIPPNLRKLVGLYGANELLLERD